LQYYNDAEAKKYTCNSRIQEIQAAMTERAVELLSLPDRPCLVLDIGCGSGLSGEVLEDNGHTWVGLDISPAMLNIAAERDCNGDLFLQDAGQGVGYRPGVFDGAIGISSLQWLCNSDYKHQNPRRRLIRFFTTLYGALAHGARAIFQYYPESSHQTELITSCAMLAGFTGGLVVDYPNSAKRKKYFLCLMVGRNAGANELPSGPADNKDDCKVSVGQRDRSFSTRNRQSIKRRAVKDRDWVLRKKESRRKKGEVVPMDSKFTARKRKPRF
jgi:18S rRNA (guanine1575-N7)-methyltransferase